MPDVIGDGLARSSPSTREPVAHGKLLPSALQHSEASTNLSLKDMRKTSSNSNNNSSSSNSNGEELHYQEDLPEKDGENKHSSEYTGESSESKTEIPRSFRTEDLRSIKPNTASTRITAVSPERYPTRNVNSTVRTDESPSKRNPTSRVIESLQTTIDDLRRELRDKTVQNDDLKRSNAVLKAQALDLKSKLSTAVHQQEVYSGMASRLEKKIAELTEELRICKQNLETSSEKLEKTEKFRNSMEEENARLKEDKDRLSASYEIVLSDFKKMKSDLMADMQDVRRTLSDKIRYYSSKVEDFEKYKETVTRQSEELERLKAVYEESIESYRAKEKHIDERLQDLAKSHDRIDIDKEQNYTEILQKCKALLQEMQSMRADLVTDVAMSSVDEALTLHDSKNKSVGEENL